MKIRDKVFSQMRKTGLKLNKAKCEFLIKQLTYLGHLIIHEGIKPDPPPIIKAIIDMPIPENKKDMQRFFGNDKLPM